MSTNKFWEDLLPLRECVEPIYEELITSGDTPKLPLTTLPGFNKKIWGLHPGLTVIGARSSMGKSSLALQIAYDLASQGHHTLFLSLEMDRNSLVKRLFCNVMKVDNFELLTGKMKTDLEMQEKWKVFAEILETLPLLITDGIGKTFDEVTKLVELVKPMPRVVIIDYIQAIKQVGGTEREVLNEYIRNFRQYCLENKIAGILCSQNNRQTLLSDDNQPSLNTLKGSGVLEEMADIVILLHWDNFYVKNSETKNDYKVIIAKNRNGRTGTHQVNFFPEYYRFEEKVSKEEIISLFGEEEIK